jgi:hypothetical protein
MAMMAPLRGLEDAEAALRSGVTTGYPFFGILLYAPGNGLDGRLHEYVVEHWEMLNGLTGPNVLLMALEDTDQGREISDFRPEDVYDIARLLGVAVDAVPAIALFESVATREHGVRLQLGSVLSHDVTDADLTQFFRGVAAAIDGCADQPEGKRVACLEKNFAARWPRDSPWYTRVSAGAKSLVAVAQPAVSFLQSLSEIVRLVRTL